MLSMLSAHFDIDNSLTSAHSEWHLTIVDTDCSFESHLKDTSLHVGTMVDEITT